MSISIVMAEKPMRKFYFQIEGITCTSCVTHIKETLEAIEGINRADVSYANASADVDTSSSVNANDIIGAIGALGYTAQERRSPKACCASET
ncbi:MAG: cation transporter [Caldilineaceae bacterium]|nr:cation transporter [Caldilineaceae bacterium]